MAPLFLILVFVVVVAWFASEYQGRVWLRQLLGCAAIVLVALGAGLGGTLLERINGNAWYSSASADLIDATVAGLEEGRTDEVLMELKHLRGRFQPTYENRSRYDRLVEEFVENVRRGKKDRR